MVVVINPQGFPCGFFLPVEVRKKRVSDPWWLSRRSELLDIATSHTDAFVYDQSSIESAIDRLLALTSVNRILYALKANFNPDVIRCIAAKGADFDCVSPGEIATLRDTVRGIENNRILFTPNFAPRHEYQWAVDEGIQLTLDNIYPLQAWPEIFAGRDLLLRVDPGEGQGHHDHVKTAGNQSKFGIAECDLDEAQRLVHALDITVTGIHAHIGSGIQDAAFWPAIAKRLMQIAERFPGARILDLGGGFSVPARPGDEVFDLDSLDDRLSGFAKEHPDFELWLEPGRFLVSEAGVLLTHVTQLKQKDEQRYIGVSTGINSLIRPALYNAYHHIVNLTRYYDEASGRVNIVGPICESGDRLGQNRQFPETMENDVILIANAGAYGSVMSSRYNLRDPAPEVFLQ